MAAYGVLPSETSLRSSLTAAIHDFPRDLDDGGLRAYLRINHEKQLV
jgi:hypothetical protein